MANPLPECPSFVDWYQVIHGRDPFPWQDRLANQVHDSQSWPELVGVPTGLGKTACLDIAIWALASQASLPPAERTAPTRLWWVVNRRLLVDNTYEHARHIERLLTKADNGPLAAVAYRLRHIAGSPNSKNPPLEVMRLRGGADRHRPSTPAQPAVLCSTIPMYGSRILFRGYGTSRSMRPIDAALSYTDSLVIIDEAHLAVHLQELLAGLAELDAAKAPTLPEGRRSPKVVALTATGDPDMSRFDLDRKDHSHSVIRNRLHAAKPMHLQPLEGTASLTKRANEIVASVGKLTLDSEPSVTLVFVNSPITARAVASRLRTKRLFDSNNVVVATGQIRGFEATRVTDLILREVGAEQRKAPRDQHFIIVATQTLEVGADIDADYLITEACGVRALTQRLGRLNRLGNRPHAKGIYIHTPPGKDGRWPIYNEEPAVVWERLQSQADDKQVVSLPPAKIASILGSPNDTPTRAPVIAEGILWEWIKTSRPPPGEAPINPYFAGINDPEQHVNIVWRSHLPEPGNRLWPRIKGDEIVEVFVSDARKAIEGLDSDCWALLDSDNITIDSPSLDLHPGNTILIRSDVGLLDIDGHWDTKASKSVLDVSILRSGIPLEEDALKRFYGHEIPEEVKRIIGSFYAYDENSIKEDSGEIEENCHRLCDLLIDAVPFGATDEEWTIFLAGIKEGIDDRARKGLSVLVEPNHEITRLPLPYQNNLNEFDIFDEHDELSLLPSDSNSPSSLSGHGQHTAQWANRIVDSLGIRNSLSRIIVEAARLHDIGKSDTRFQASLDPGRVPSDELKAKSNKVPRSRWESNRVAAGWPKGGRHEELSRRLIYKWLSRGSDLDYQEIELLQHLVVSHHGHGRPFVSPINDPTCGDSLSYDLDGVPVMINPDLSIADWKQPTRFAKLNELHGPWELALMETIIRQSDWRASRAASKLEKN